MEYSMGMERQYHKATDATYICLHGQVNLGHDNDHLYVTNWTFLFRHSWQSTFHERSLHFKIELHYQRGYVFDQYLINNAVIIYILSIKVSIFAVLNVLRKHEVKDGRDR